MCTQQYICTVYKYCWYSVRSRQLLIVRKRAKKEKRKTGWHLQGSKKFRVVILKCTDPLSNKKSILEQNSSFLLLIGVRFCTVPALSQKTFNRAQADFHILGALERAPSYAALSWFGTRKDVFRGMWCTINGALGPGQSQNEGGFVLKLRHWRGWEIFFHAFNFSGWPSCELLSYEQGRCCTACTGHLLVWICGSCVHSVVLYQ